MRPLELHLKNFRSFSGETSFTFADRGLLGIVGPIGSGKSSILDGVAYALYARTPRVAGAVRDLIHQRSDTAVVTLEFAVDGERWKVTRSIRRGQSNHTLYRMDDDEGDVAVATQKTDVNERVEQLIGLDYDGFSRSVLLAQGRFAEFLTARPADRDRVLKGVFGHERIDAMRQAAKERVSALALDIEKLAGRLEAAEHAEARLDELRQAATGHAERLEQLQKAQPRIADHDRRLDEIADRAKVIAERLAALDGRIEHLPASTAAKASVEAAEAARRRRGDIAARLEEQQQAVAEAEAALATLVETIPQIDEAAEVLQRRTLAESKLVDKRTQVDAVAGRIAALDAEIAAADTALVTARTAATQTSNAVDQAIAAEAEARTTLDAVRHANMAHTLRRELATGEPCPVCQQTVATVPATDAPAAMGSAEEALSAAGALVSRRRTAAAEATTALAAQEQARRSLDEQLQRHHAEKDAGESALETLAGEVATLDGRLTGLLGPGDPAETLRDRRSRLAEARDAVDAARKSVERERALHDQAIVDEQTATKDIADMKMAAARVAAALDLEFDDHEGADALTGALGRLRSAIDGERERLADERGLLETERADLTTRRAELLGEVGVEGDIAHEIAATEATLATTSEQIGRIEADLAAAGEQRRRLEELDTTRSHFARIVSDLTDAKFVRFLLDDERVRLSIVSSQHFEYLSAGRYRFSDDGTFDIVDLATADAVRKADTLSGGETFLASLALSLGLAEMVTRTGGRLEAFFLDEGFGTLDPEHLNLAMEGIERLVTDTGDRLVVVVSHVPELRQRIEDLIELDKDPLTGDTVVKRA